MIRFTITAMALAWLILFLNAVCPAEAADYASPDYAEAERWLHLPDNGGDLPVDVIYLYPTAWTPRPGDDRMYCDIDEESMLDGARYAYELQASVFEPAANIYAPFYRQSLKALAQIAAAMFGLSPPSPGSGLSIIFADNIW